MISLVDVLAIHKLTEPELPRRLWALVKFYQANTEFLLKQFYQAVEPLDEADYLKVAEQISAPKLISIKLEWLPEKVSLNLYKTLKPWIDEQISI